MASKAVKIDLDMESNAKVINLPTPSASGDAVTKGYVDGRTPKITVGTVAPGSPATGDLWVDTN